MADIDADDAGDAGDAGDRANFAENMKTLCFVTVFEELNGMAVSDASCFQADEM